MTRAENQPRKRIVPTQDFRAIFPADVTAKILARLTAVGKGARLRIRDDGEKTFAYVLPPDGAVFAADDDDPGEFDNAFRCPPNVGCP